MAKLAVRLVINVHQCPQGPDSGLGTCTVTSKMAVLRQQGTGSRINFGLKENFDSTFNFLFMN